MRVKRYREKDMQTALTKVRAELGRDAVLISSRRVDGLLEVLAANDYDPEKLKEKMQNLPPATAAEQPISVRPPPPKPVVTKVKEDDQSPKLQEMQEELGRLRKLFEGEMAQLAWREPKSRQPNRMALLSRLEVAGINHNLSAKLADKVLPCDDLELCWQRAVRTLVNAIKKPASNPLQDGGIIALVGSTGVGKTTTAVKLATQFAKTHGRNQVALITTDDFRVGQREQLVSLTSSLGLSMQVAANKQEMESALDSFSERKLVIIDTAGVNQRSRDFKKLYSVLLSGGRKVSPYLVLSATAQEAVTNESIQAFSKLKPAAAIVTKTDENVSIGPVLSGLIRNRLPAIYVGTGQNIPDDLAYATRQFFAKKINQSYLYFNALSRRRRSLAG